MQKAPPYNSLTDIPVPLRYIIASLALVDGLTETRIQQLFYVDPDLLMQILDAGHPDDLIE